MRKIIGIDLGTTNSLMSYIDESGRPRLIPNAEGKMLTPSTVYINEKNIQVGETALNRAMTEREFVVRGIKRNMGDESYLFQGLTPKKISAEILKKLKRDAEAYFNVEVGAAVITVPAYFTDKPRSATKQAGELAGFSVLDLPNEPTAAALYYGTAQMNDKDSILVYDLGGGTMDASVLKYEKSRFTVLASDGSQSLGGNDWTQRLVDLVSREYEEVYGCFPTSDRRVEQMIIEECEKAKQALMTMDVVQIPLSHEGKIHVVSISIEQFEEMTGDLLLNTMIKVESALNKAHIEWATLSKILLVGGSTRLRMVERKLKEISGIIPTKFQNVDELVALGAALYTQQEITSNGKRQIAIVQQSKGRITIAPRGSTGIKIITVDESTTHGLGTVVIDPHEKSPKLVTSIIIKPHTAIPAEVSRNDYQTKMHQTEIVIPIVQTDCDGLDPYSCYINKSYCFSGIPDRDHPSQICVTFQYNKEAIIDVNAVDIISNQILEKEVIDFTLPDMHELPSHLQIILAIDTSGSMSGQPLEDAKKEVKKVCVTLRESDCCMGLIQFGAEVAVVHTLTSDLNKIENAVDPLFAGNGTPMGEGLSLALEQLLDAPGTKIVILVSDGFPNDEYQARDSAKKLKEAGITLNTISIGEEGAEFLQSIGDAYTRINSTSGLSEAIVNLLRRM